MGGKYRIVCLRCEPVVIEPGLQVLVARAQQIVPTSRVKRQKVHFIKTMYFSNQHWERLCSQIQIASSIIDISGIQKGTKKGFWSFHQEDLSSKIYIREQTRCRHACPWGIFCAYLILW